ncbi:Helix-turn-helix domain-containing protein [Lachnospiraceae bacterium NE2001]|nr:Helix-turn-helix domain-containing protein [Lachnospiraceae bacterium NE2001]
MGRRSTKTNKNIYFRSREEAGLTRAEASEAMGYVSESRIDKIENERTTVQPEDVVAMAEAYKKPSLCNYYCTHECRIGQDTVAEVHPSSLAELSLGIFNSLNALDAQKTRLMEIAEDGTIRDDEAEDFAAIQENLNKISNTIESLKLWISQAVADGKIKPL